MGTGFSNQEKCTVSILNYSNIYLSPFEFYGIDNWEQLQGIGKIFQEQLKEEYKNLITQSLKEAGGSLSINFPKAYNRSQFEWYIGELGKQFNLQRYSPLYPTQESLSKQVVGIKKGENETLQSRQQFFECWDKKFEKALEQKKSQKFDKNQPDNKLYMFQLKYFDYLCYKAMIIYVYKKINMGAKLFMDYRVNIQSDFFTTTKHDKIIEEYKDLLYKYAKRIPKNKEELTIKHLFNRRSPEIIILAEASTSLIQLLKKHPQYQGEQARKEKQTKKTLLLVKKNLTFGNQNIRKISYKNQLNDQTVQGIVINLLVEQFQSLNRTAILQQLKEFYQLNIRDKTKDNQAGMNIKKTFSLTIARKSKDKADQAQETLSQISKQEAIIKSSQADKQKKIKKFFAGLQQHGFLNWIYQQGNFKCFEGKDNKSVYVGAFHFSSQAQLNQLQIQVLGLILYHIACKKQSKFIVAADFNSFVSLEKKDNHLGLFQFVRHMTRKQADKQRIEAQINTMIKQMDVFPKNSKMITTKKKRTMLQPQFKKANQLAQQCRDQILTNYKFVKKTSHICEIKDIGTRKTDNQSFLPNAEHPFDHFVVEATLDLSQGLK